MIPPILVEKAGELEAAVREKFPALWNEALLEMTVKKQEDDG